MNPNKTTKKCTRCQEYTPLFRMVKSRHSPDGYSAICKACKRLKNRQHKSSCKSVSAKERGEYCGSWLGDAAVYL